MRVQFGMIKRVACWILCGVLLLSGCTVQFLYNRLDWLIPWYIGDYIDLTTEQSHILQGKLSTQLNWHRTTQLPSYADSIYRITVDLRDGFTRQELDGHFASMETYWKRLALRLTPDMVALLTMISERQAQDLMDALDDKHRKYREKYVDPPEMEQRRKRAEKVSELVRDWLGAINPAQQQAVTDWSQRYQLTSQATLRYRQAWQTRLGRLLAHRQDGNHYYQEFEDSIVHPERDWSEEYRRSLEVNRELSKDLILELDRQATPEQQSHLVRKLNGLAYDFRELASNAPQ